MEMKIYQLGAIPKNQSVGGKARCLDALIREGHQVPQGLSLSFSSPEIFHQFLHDLENTTTPSAQLENILQQLEGLSDKLIVRSSAPLEDGHQLSFAGIFLSLQCQRNPESLRRALLECMQALHSKQALSYRASNPLLHLVIQEFIDAQFSGVLFLNPNGTAQVEVVWGDCEQLVSGKTTPFTLEYANKKLNLLRTTNSTTCALRKNWSRVYPKLVELVETSLAANPNTGADIEWLVDGKNQIRLLQRRPITRPLPASSLLSAPTPPAIGAPFAKITNVNLKENYPKAVKPFVLSVASNSYRRYFQHVSETLGVSINEENSPLFASSVCNVDGSIFYNMSAIESLIDYLPLGPFIKSYFHQFIGYSEKASTQNPKDKMPLKEKILLGKFVVRSLLAIRSSRKKVNRFGKEVQDFITLSQQGRLSLDAQLAKFLNFRFDRWRPLAISDYSALLSFGTLNSFLKFLAPAFYKKNQVSFLLLAIDDLISTQNSTALGEVIAQVLNTPGLAQEWQSSSNQVVLKNLSENPLYAPTLALFKKYQMEWGFRFSQELTLDEENYLENPGKLVELIRALLMAKQDFNPKGKHAALSESFQKHYDIAVAQIQENGRIAKLCGPWAFRFLLNWTRNSLRYRELSRTHQARLYAQLRQTLLQLGDQFAQQGLLLYRDDIFFLTYQEIQAVIRRQFAFPESLPEQIFIRKQFYSDAVKKGPPAVQTSFKADELFMSTSALPTFAETNEPLEGLVACAGLIEGRAVVIQDLTDIHLVKNGDILVTMQTDPGWSPVFPLIQGLIVEHGGILSHGAILAREFGIPCLIGVANVTGRIKTGDLIRIDGERGQVFLI